MSNKKFIRRVTRDMEDIRKEPLDYLSVYVDPDKLHIWYFKIHGREDSPFKGGEFLGMIELPKTYPFKAPDFTMLTPNGRFDTGKKICMSNSGFHPEEWSPLWSMTNLLVGFISAFFDEDVSTHIGVNHLRTTNEIKKNHAAESLAFNFSLKANKYFQSEDDCLCVWKGKKIAL